MVAQLLQPSDILQRRLDILGIVSNVELSSSGSLATYRLFQTGSIAYPAPNNRVFVAYVIIEFSAGAPSAAGACLAAFGVSGGFDWLGYSWDLKPAGNIFTPPYVLSPTLNNQGSGFYNPPVYTRGQPFTVYMASTITPPVTTRATFTAVGWAE